MQHLNMDKLINQVEVLSSKGSSKVYEKSLAKLDELIQLVNEVLGTLEGDSDSNSQWKTQRQEEDGKITKRLKVASKSASALAKEIKKKSTTAKSYMAKEFKAVYNKAQKLNETVPAAFPYDLRQLLSPCSFKKSAIIDLIIDSFCRQDRLSLARRLMCEAPSGRPKAADCTMLQNYKRLFAIRNALLRKDEKPALEWLAVRQQQLVDKGMDVAGDSKMDVAGDNRLRNLSFELHKLHFLNILEEAAACHDAQDHRTHQQSAVTYAREYLGVFYRTHAREIGKLTTLLLFSHDLMNSPSAHLFTPNLVHQIISLFEREYYHSIDLPLLDPLTATLDAGFTCLPHTLKVQQLIADNPGLLQEENDSTMTADIHLGDHLQFHSTFVCPVSKDMATEENPPLLLKCGHAISTDAMLKIVSSSPRRNFKCPTCPTEQRPCDTLTLHLW